MAHHQTKMLQKILHTKMLSQFTQNKVHILAIFHGTPCKVFHNIGKLRHVFYIRRGKFICRVHFTFRRLKVLYIKH